MDKPVQEKVLLVEDEENTASRLRDQLQTLGYQVTAIAGNGEQAISSLEKGDANVVILGSHFQTQPPSIQLAELVRERFHIPVRLFSSSALSGAPVDILPPVESSEMAAAVLQERRKYFWLSSALRSAADSIVIVDPEGRIQFINPAAERLTEFPLVDSFGKIYQEVLILEYRGSKLTDDLIGLATLNMQPLSLGRELVLISRSGQRHQVEGEIAAASADSGAPGSIVFTLRDVTRRKWEEHQQRDEHAIRAVERLAETTAHTLNNLLTSILGHSDLLLHHAELSADQHDTVNQIHLAAQNVAAVVRQLSRISRPKTVTRVDIDVNALVKAYVPVLASSLPATVEISADLAPSVQRVSADPEQLEHLLFILVANARDAISGSGTIRVSTESVTVDESERLRSTRCFVAVKVHDSGEGMTEETVERIFEPFFTLRKDRGHVGLGLSIAQGIVRDYQGFLDVKSQPGLGTEITFALPALEPDPYAYLDEDASQPASSAVKTVLVVEDDHAVRQLVRKILEKNSYQVVEAEDGEDALLVAELDEGRVDVLISDVVMPGISGPDLVRQFAKLHPETKFLLISGFSAAKMGPRSSMPADARFLQKPFNQSELLEHIRALIAEA